MSRKSIIGRNRKILQRVRSKCRKALRVDLRKTDSMKNLKFALVICMLFIVTGIQAQIKFGPKVGLNLSTITLKMGSISIDPKTVVGFHVGMISEIPLVGNFCLQPGLLYSAKGSKWAESGEEIKLTPSFLEIPVNAVYKFDLKAVKILINAGPNFAFGIGGKYKYTFGTTNESGSLKFGSSSGDDMKPFDLGLNIGAGVEITQIIISANYGFGLTNLAPTTTNDEKMKTRVFGLSVAYLFGGK
jgi:hypothetical protein